jgi:hypothetical protein
VNNYITLSLQDSRRTRGAASGYKVHEGVDTYLSCSGLLVRRTADVGVATGPNITYVVCHGAALAPFVRSQTATVDRDQVLASACLATTRLLCKSFHSSVLKYFIQSVKIDDDIASGRRHADLLPGTRIDVLAERGTGSSSLGPFVWHACQLVFLGDVPGVQAVFFLKTNIKFSRLLI